MDMTKEEFREGLRKALLRKKKYEDIKRAERRFEKTEIEKYIGHKMSVISARQKIYKKARCRK